SNSKLYDVTGSCLDIIYMMYSLKYFYTSSSGIPNFPEFVVVVLVNEVQIIHYDSNTKRAVPKQEWMNKITEDDPRFWEEETNMLNSNELTSKVNIAIVKQRFKRTEGPHIVQRMSGCEWDDKTYKINGFEQYGYDGEDFLVLNMTTETWIAPRQEAVITTNNLNNNKAQLAYFKFYYTKECTDWLKKFLYYGKCPLMRKDLPSVSLLQKTPSSPLTCHATGFYPDRAQMFWKKDEEELHEDVVRGEILPNHDGSFQMSVDLGVSWLRDDWNRYSCVFQLAGVQEDVITPLDKRVILTNWRRRGASMTVRDIHLHFSYFFPTFIVILTLC
uniref:Ig-like domain-containing protein n=1 Tax=Salarias fasciatus TaxID=181472 RepID=A0A672IFR5_SALFA